MDGIALGTPPRFRVASPCFLSSRFQRRLLSLDPAPGVPVDRLGRPCALRCTTDEEAYVSWRVVFYDLGWLETEGACDPSTSAEQKIANSVEIKEWQNGNVVDNAASRQGIQIRRRPSTGPPKHYVGPFEFRLENEGNTPRNILEKIIWDKDTEVSQAFSNSYTLVVKIASAYEKFGATCISVLTDEKYFQVKGSFENLEAIRRAGVKVHNEREMDRVVGESGLFTPEDISYVQDAGVKAVTENLEEEEGQRAANPCFAVVRRAEMAQKLQQQLKEVGSKLENPPASKDALIKLLKVGASSRIWDSFLSMSFLFEIKKREKKRRAWISSRVAQFVARSPRVVRSVARFPRVARFVSPHGEKKRLPSWGERTRRPCGIK
ncbi:hypothetical protein GW17_00040753, partial [Ensete ventricosum]